MDFDIKLYPQILKMLNLNRKNQFAFSRSHEYSIFEFRDFLRLRVIERFCLSEIPDTPISDTILLSWFTKKFLKIASFTSP